MSQSRFSIVLVGVSALLRRPLVSRLRPAGFTARGSGGFRRSVSPSVSALAAGRVGLRAHGFRFSARTASGLPSASWFFCLPFRRLPLGGLAFGFTASAFRPAPLRKLPSAGWFFRWAGWSSGSFLPLFGPHRFGDCPRRVGLRVHRFRFSACTASEIALGELVLPPSALEIALGELVLPLSGLPFGLIASAFRQAQLRGGPGASGVIRVPNQSCL